MIFWGSIVRRQEFVREAARRVTSCRIGQPHDQRPERESVIAPASCPKIGLAGAIVPALEIVPALAIVPAEATVPVHRETDRGSVTGPPRFLVNDREQETGRELAHRVTVQA